MNADRELEQRRCRKAAPFSCPNRANPYRNRDQIAFNQGPIVVESGLKFGSFLQVVIDAASPKSFPITAISAITAIPAIWVSPYPSVHLQKSRPNLHESPFGVHPGGVHPLSETNS